MEVVRAIHIICAILTGISFFVRGLWMIQGSPSSQARLQARLTRILPHLVDSILLGSALLMVWQWSLHPLQLPWLLAKILALFVYIGCGLMAFRFANNRRVKILFWGLALLVLVFIYTTAISKAVFFLPLAV